MSRHELAIRIGKDPQLSDISVLGLDPGGMGTDLIQRGAPTGLRLQVKYLMPVVAAVSVKLAPNGMLRPVWKSAADVVQGCFDVAPPPKGTALYLNGSEELQTGEESRKEELRRELWRYGLGAAGIKPEDTVLKNWE